MKYIQVLLICVILVKQLSCKRIETNSSVVANLKQEQFIRGSLDFYANPCEDFYQYACGGWENFNENVDKEYHTVLTLVDYKVNKELADVLSGSNLQDQPKFVNTAYRFFKSCKDLKKYELINYLKRLTDLENVKFALLGSLPEELDWVRTLAVMHIYGVKGIFVQHFLNKGKFALNNVIDLYRPFMYEGYERLNSLTLENFESVKESFGGSFNDSSKLWRQVKAFELELQRVLDTDSRQEEVKDLQLPWVKDYMKILLNQTDLNKDVEINLHNEPYLMALDDLLERHSKLFVCKYLEIRFLWHLLDQRTEHECVDGLRIYLPKAMDWLYEQQHPELKAELPEITRLFDNIRKQFSNTIKQNVHGFNETVVEFLLAKINDMRLIINNLPRKDTVPTLEKFYDKLDLNDDDDFYVNHLKSMKFYFMVTNTLENYTTDEKEFFYIEDWDTGTPSSVYFLTHFNAVTVPLTGIQPPLYQPHSADVFKYSTLGFRLAQAMLYGFDNNGLQYDHKGNRVSQEYSHIFTNPLFNGRFNCLLEFNPTTIRVKTSDLSSLRYAYKIFNDSRTDGMDVSVSKLFFINFAQCFCGSSYTDTFVTDAVYGTDRTRVTDVLKNFPEFSKAFQCNSGNRMYQDKECYLWR